MRMRRKKNLNERLTAVEPWLKMPETQEKDFRTAESALLDLDAWFGRTAPLELEIGCGKGSFICEMASQRPQVNFLAVERSANVIVEACERAKREDLTNVRFLKCTAEYLPRYLRPDSVSRLYLNFSCPFPKKKYAVHRLTHPRFLAIYRMLLVSGAEIHQKTDNRLLFECSLEWLSQNGFVLQNVSLDLHHSDFEGNILTEYEQRFATLGQPIYRLEAYVRPAESCGN